MFLKWTNLFEDIVIALKKFRLKLPSECLVPGKLYLPNEIKQKSSLWFLSHGVLSDVAHLLDSSFAHSVATLLLAFLGEYLKGSKGEQ